MRTNIRILSQTIEDDLLAIRCDVECSRVAVREIGTQLLNLLSKAFRAALLSSPFPSNVALV
jgi:hypothetical protein